MTCPLCGQPSLPTPPRSEVGGPPEGSDSGGASESAVLPAESRGSPSPEPLLTEHDRLVAAQKLGYEQGVKDATQELLEIYNQQEGATND